jgi:hypothetical protein
MSWLRFDAWSVSDHMLVWLLVQPVSTGRDNEQGGVLLALGGGGLSGW